MRTFTESNILQLQLVFILIACCFFGGCTHLGSTQNANVLENNDQQKDTIAENKIFTSKPNGDFDLISPQKLTLSKQNPKLQSEKALDESTLETNTELDADHKNAITLDEALYQCELAQIFWQKGEIESAIDALDHAFELIIQVDTSNVPDLIQQKDDLRFMISKRILEIYASRNIVLNGNHNAIPIVLNKHVQREIDLFTKGRERKFFIESYKRSGLYRQKIVADLKEAGLPEELSWLPLIESGFKVKAFSRARALGLWQFIPSTGYKFGMKRNTYIDERLDPDRATQAAIAYLEELHKLFGDWSTVLAAYNCGEGRVLKVIQRQNIQYLDHFWDLYQKLPSETARYVPRFLATLHIIQNKKKYGLDKIQIYTPLEYETTTVNRRIHLNDIAQTIGISRKVLKQLNPELRRNILPDDHYVLKIPKGTKEIFIAKIDQVKTASIPQSEMIYHRVRRGETLSTIAKRYKTSTRRIARANHINRRNLIVAGKKLKIPVGRTYHLSNSTYRKTITGKSKHIVRKGDSLWIIAKRYGTTTRQLQLANNLTSTKLSIGQVLKISNNKVSKTATNQLKKYKVKPGDSPFNIAVSHQMSLDNFLNINNLTKRCKIFPGQILLVKN